MNTKMALASLALSTAVVVAPAYAGAIVPISATPSSSYPTYPGTDAIDGNSVTDWAANGTGNGSYIDFDLGGLYFLSSADVVDRVTSGGNNGGFVGGTTDFTTDFTLSYSLTAGGPAFFTQDFTKTTPASPTSLSSFAYTASLNPSTKVEFVRYTVVAANGPNPGLSAISFTGSVPEPTTWAMMLAGFGMIGFAARRRQFVKTAVTFA